MLNEWIIKRTFWYSLSSLVAKERKKADEKSNIGRVFYYSKHLTWQIALLFLLLPFFSLFPPVFLLQWKQLWERGSENVVCNFLIILYNRHIMFRVSQHGRTLSFPSSLNKKEKLKNCFASQWCIFDRVNIITGLCVILILIFSNQSAFFFFPLDSFVSLLISLEVNCFSSLMNEKKGKQQLDWF